MCTSDQHLCHQGILWYIWARNLISNKMLTSVPYSEGLFIESWSGSTGYSAEMLTEGAQCWWVENESTWAPLVNIHFLVDIILMNDILHLVVVYKVLIKLGSADI